MLCLQQSHLQASPPTTTLAGFWLALQYLVLVGGAFFNCLLWWKPIEARVQFMHAHRAELQLKKPLQYNKNIKCHHLQTSFYLQEKIYIVFC
jgi:hypothetical protein